MRRIFVSYRRDDSKADAGRICDHLVDRFGKNQVFFDIDTIPPGEDFNQYLQAKVSECDILVAVIGKQWLAATDERGARRLDNPNDFVRLEIARALQRNIPVFPILVDGASVPRAQDLPDELAALSRQQAIELRHLGFRQQLQLLFRAIEDKRRAQSRARRSRFFRFALALVLSRTGRIAIAGICVLAFVAVYIMRQHSFKPSASSNGGQNMLIKCIPACTANTNFALDVSYAGVTRSGNAMLAVLLPESADLISWYLTSPDPKPIPSGWGVKGYTSGDVFTLLRIRGNYPIDFNTFRRLSGDVGVSVTSYRLFAFRIGEVGWFGRFTGSKESIGRITFSRYSGAQGFPAGAIFFAFIADKDASQIFDQTPLNALAVVQ